MNRFTSRRRVRMHHGTVTVTWGVTDFDSQVFWMVVGILMLRYGFDASRTTRDVSNPRSAKWDL